MSFRLTVVSMLALLLSAAVAGAAGEEVFPHDEARPAAGHWVGTLGADNGASGFTALLVKGGGAAPWSVEWTFLPLGALHQEIDDATVEGRTLRFEAATRAGALRFDIEVSDDGQTMTGTLAMGEGEAAVNGTTKLHRAPRPLDLPEAMAFPGVMAVPGSGDLRFAIVIAETPGGGFVGHVDVPVQGVRALPLVDVTLVGDVFRAVMPIPGPPPTIEGEFDTDRRKFTGTFRQGPFIVEINLDRDDAYAYRDLPRPQHPEPPYPYREREVTLAAGTGLTIAGTLTLPDVAAHGPGPYAAAVLISGSGQQDRDETLLGHKPFLVIADHLARRGIAVMRYDDRGVGSSTVDDPALVAGATSLDFAKDALAVMRHLQTLPEIDGARIGFVGHSEGGLIGPLVTTMADDVAYLVLLAGPGATGRDILSLQLALGLEANGGDPVEAKKVSTHIDRAVGLVLDGADAAAVRAALEPAAAATLAASGLPAGSAMLEPVVTSYETLISSPWAAYFLAHDPLPVLRDVTCPVLAMNGTLDLQVWHEQNLDAIERAMTEAGRDVTARRYDGLNHLFQPAGTGSAAEYATIETTFDETALRDMAAWIRERTGGATRE